jgi:hypothetical protein
VAGTKKTMATIQERLLQLTAAATVISTNVEQVHKTIKRSPAPLSTAYPDDMSVTTSFYTAQQSKKRLDPKELSDRADPTFES